MELRKRLAELMRVAELKVEALMKAWGMVEVMKM